MNIELLETRRDLAQRLIDLTTGTDVEQVVENIRELDKAIKKIEAKQPVKTESVTLRVRRHMNRYLAPVQLSHA